MNRIMSKVYIFFADGFEDIEGLTVVDLMRRAGIDIETVSIRESREITTSHGIEMKTDRVFKEEILREKYHTKLDYYARALEQLTGKCVKEKIIYSFAMKKEIEV